MILLITAISLCAMQLAEGLMSLDEATANWQELRSQVRALHPNGDSSSILVSASRISRDAVPSFGFVFSEEALKKYELEVANSV